MLIMHQWAVISASLYQQRMNFYIHYFDLSVLKHKFYFYTYVLLSDKKIESDTELVSKPELNSGYE